MDIMSKITKNELKDNINDYVIIDVREADEFENGKIENSQNMPLGLVIRNIKQGKIDNLKDKKICTYCASGYRGNIASDELTKAGFNAVNLEGGFMAWIN